MELYCLWINYCEDLFFSGFVLSENVCHERTTLRTIRGFKRYKKKDTEAIVSFFPWGPRWWDPRGCCEILMVVPSIFLSSKNEDLFFSHLFARPFPYPLHRLSTVTYDTPDSGTNFMGDPLWDDHIETFVTSVDNGNRKPTIKTAISS